jgi:1-acyl-sn-glycerol-3-phosphate acyltransferase
MLRCLFFTLIVRPLCLVVLGMNVRHRERLPRGGPAIVAANHNSHLDTLVLITLFPLRHLARLRPVAAQDYFFRNRFLKWFALNIVGIIPIQRSGDFAGNPLEPIEQALDRGEIVIYFPEGSRGDPERPAEFKSGVAHLARARPSVPVFPIYMHGLGKALPRGETLLVPFFCDVFVGEPLLWCGNRQTFMQSLKERMTALAAEGEFAAWE